MTEAYHCDGCGLYTSGPPPVEIRIRDVSFERDGTRVRATPPEFEGLPGDYCRRCAGRLIGHEEVSE